MSNKIKIGKKLIGDGQPIFIVAELSGNHNQDINRAYKLIDEAANAGVDAVKLQTYTPDTMTIDSDGKYFQVNVNDAWKGQTLYQLYKTAYTPWEWQAKLKKYAEKKGLILFSAPFDETAVDFLENMGVLVYKVASFEIGDIELLKKIGKTKKPVIISRGMATKEEINLALTTLRKYGSKQLAVLHCVSSYPANLEEMNLATIPDLVKNFKVVVGLSDHSLGIVAAVTSVALGAKIIEKHLTIKRSDGGPDAAFSLEPQELEQLVKSVRDAEKAIGKVQYGSGKKESVNLVFKRSLFVIEDIKAGENFTLKNVKCIRPGFGLAPKEMPKVLGKKAKTNIKRGTPLSWNLISR
ncbi:MAG: pseudaminic acid synthase [Candidatus Staskawiczbacteria bacterium]|nr:pseudaminic acid synthase [Candidatus Staskawiczbacteria bacterium]